MELLQALALHKSAETTIDDKLIAIFCDHSEAENAVYFYDVQEPCNRYHNVKYGTLRDVLVELYENDFDEDNQELEKADWQAGPSELDLKNCSCHSCYDLLLSCHIVPACIPWPEALLLRYVWTVDALYWRARCLYWCIRSYWLKISSWARSGSDE